MPKANCQAYVALNASQYEISIYTDLDEAREHWKRIERDGQALVFQSYAWGSTWLDTIGKTLRVEPCLVHLRHDLGEWFLPMVIDTVRFGVRRLEFLDGGLSDHCGPVMLGHTAAPVVEQLPKIARRIAAMAKVDVVDCRHQRGFIGSYQNPLVSARSSKTPYASHRLGIQGKWSAYAENTLSRSHLAGSRRRWRRLLKAGTPSFVIPKAVDQALAILDVTLRHKAERYAATGRPDPFLKSGHAEFYREMTRRHLSTGLVQIAALKLDDVVVASHWGCIYRDDFHWLMPAYDAAWSQCSPGRLLLDHLIEFSFERGLKSFDFTIGDEPYKSTFADDHEFLHRSQWSRNPLGFLYTLKD